MNEYLQQMLHGPGSMRFILQPIVAVIIGLLHGMRGRRAGLRGIWLPLTVALSASLIFQALIRSEVHLVNAILYALIFVALPYFLAREVTARAHDHTRRVT
jgi:hypothetical protein